MEKWLVVIVGFKKPTYYGKTERWQDGKMAKVLAV